MMRYAWLVLAACSSTPAAPTAKTAKASSNTGRPQPTKLAWTHMKPNGSAGHAAVSRDGRTLFEVIGDKDFTGTLAVDATGATLWKLEDARDRDFAIDDAGWIGADVVLLGRSYNGMVVHGKRYQGPDHDLKFLMRLGAGGEIRWFTPMPDGTHPGINGGMDRSRRPPPHGLAVTATGEIQIASFDTLARYTPDGKQRWRKPMDELRKTFTPMAITVDADGDAYLTGYFRKSAVFDEHRLAMKGYSEDVAIARIDGKTGAFRWARALGTDGAKSTAIAVLPGGMIAIAGQTERVATPCNAKLAKGAYVAAFDARDGACRWARSYGDEPSYQASYFDGLVADGRGIVATGFLFRKGVEGADYQRVLVGLGREGEPAWQGPIDVDVHELVLSPAGTILISGFTTGKRNVLGKPLGSGSVVEDVFGAGADDHKLVAFELR